MLLKLILYELLALPTSSQVPYELLALVKIGLGKLTVHCVSASLMVTCDHLLFERLVYCRARKAMEFELSELRDLTFSYREKSWGATVNVTRAPRSEILGKAECRKGVNN